MGSALLRHEQLPSDANFSTRAHVGTAGIIAPFAN